MNTKKIKILINKINDIKEFNSKVGVHNDIDLISGRYIVPATSLMGIFSLDVSQPITMEYPAEINDFVMREFAKWIVE